jgi:predicted ribosome-associated RNA-binding protein Tma20
MRMTGHFFSQVDAGAARAILDGSSLFAVGLDPAGVSGRCEIAVYL